LAEEIRNLKSVFDVEVEDVDKDYRPDIIAGTWEGVYLFEYDRHSGYPFTEEHWTIRRHIGLEVFEGILPVLGIIMAGIVSLHFEPAFFAFEPILLASLGTSIYS
jgi:hypothetical protein